MASNNDTSISNAPISVGCWLRNARESKNLKQRQIAAKLDMDSSHLSKLERSKQPPSPDQAEALASAYDVPLAELKQRIILARLLLDCDGDSSLVAGVVQEAAAAYRVSNPADKK